MSESLFVRHIWNTDLFLEILHLLFRWIEAVKKQWFCTCFFFFYTISLVLCNLCRDLFMSLHCELLSVLSFSLLLLCYLTFSQMCVRARARDYLRDVLTGAANISLCELLSILSRLFSNEHVLHSPAPCCSKGGTAAHWRRSPTHLNNIDGKCLL